jgi:hypothetical protein
MILLTTKKAIAIYRLISSFYLIVFSISSFASADLASFCFEKTTNLSAAKESLEFLLLPKEKVFLRPEDHCFDVSTSTDRTKLLEKFLSKRYNLLSELGDSKGAVNLQNQHCNLELTTIKKREITTKDIQAGSRNNIKVTADSVQEMSTAKILLGLGRPGTLELEGKSLYVECTKGASGVYRLVFSFNEEYRAKLNTEVSVRENETIQIAQITKDLDEKRKTLGLPQSLFWEVEGTEKISYELKVR